MSGYRTHLIFYAAVMTLLFFATHQTIGWVEVTAFLFGAIYSILPDIDSPSSKIRGIVTKVVLAQVFVMLAAYIMGGNINFVYVSAAAVAVLLIIAFTKHRGVVHTPLAALALALPPAILNPIYGAAALLGYTTHLLLDGRLKP